MPEGLLFEVPHSVMQDAISMYGKVLDISYELDTHNCFTGTHIVKIHVVSQIPSYIRLGTYPMFIRYRYRSQRKCCRYCNRWDHVINTCPCHLQKRCIRCLSITHPVAQCCLPWSNDNAPLMFDLAGDLITPSQYFCPYYYATCSSLVVQLTPLLPSSSSLVVPGAFSKSHVPVITAVPVSSCPTTLPVSVPSSSVAMPTVAPTAVSSSVSGPVVSPVVVPSSMPPTSVTASTSSTWTVVGRCGSVPTGLPGSVPTGLPAPMSPVITSPKLFDVLDVLGVLDVLDADVSSSPPPSLSSVRSRSPIHDSPSPGSSSATPSSPPPVSSHKRKQKKKQKKKPPVLASARLTVDDFCESALPFASKLSPDDFPPLVSDSDLLKPSISDDVLVLADPDPALFPAAPRIPYAVPVLHPSKISVRVSTASP